MILFRKKKYRKAGTWIKIWYRFRRNKLSIIGLIIFGLFIFIGTMCQYFPIKNPIEQNWGLEDIPPNNEYLFGTDGLGRDILSRVIWGSRTSLIIGFVSVFVMTFVGISFGAISGFLGGKIDNIIMRGTDIFLSIPRLVLLIVLAANLRIKNILVTGFIIGLTSWPRMARVVRSNFLSLKEREFIEASNSMGASSYMIMFQHILPNTLSSIIVLATLSIGDAIMTEAGLSFLGLGDPLCISWGQMLSFSSHVMRKSWWRAFFPGISIFTITIGINLLGDGLRDALDVRI